MFKFIVTFSLFWLFIDSQAYARKGKKIISSSTEEIKFTLSSPNGGWTKNRMVRIKGEISDENLDPLTININGTKYFTRVTNKSFDRKFPLNSGENNIEVLGANKSGIYKKAVKVFGQFQPLPIQVVLTSDSDFIYTDLHIYEPSSVANSSLRPTEHVFWSNINSPSGGKFYLNKEGTQGDQRGYGPYLYTHQSPPLGYYKVLVNYWPGGSTNAHVVATLTITLFGGSQNEVKRIIKFPLVKSGDTRTFAWIKIDKEQKGYIYSPIVDKAKSKEIWPKWIE